MNIFFLTETESGCYKWRGAIPAKYLLRGVCIRPSVAQSEEAKAAMDCGEREDTGRPDPILVKILAQAGTHGSNLSR